MFHLSELQANTANIEKYFIDLFFLLVWIGQGVICYNVTVSGCHLLGCPLSLRSTDLGSHVQAQCFPLVTLNKYETWCSLCVDDYEDSSLSYCYLEFGLSKYRHIFELSPWSAVCPPERVHFRLLCWTSFLLFWMATWVDTLSLRMKTKMLIKIQNISSA